MILVFGRLVSESVGRLVTNCDFARMFYTFSYNNFVYLSDLV